MTIRPGLVLILALIATAQAPRAKAADYVGQIAAQLEPTRVVVYKQVGDCPLHLNVFQPEGRQPTDRRACFLI